MAVTRDATKGVWVPATAAEWTQLLSGTGIANPNYALHNCQDTADPITDAIGTDALTASGGFPAYAQTVAGWSRKAFVFSDGSAGVEIGGHAAVNTSTLTLAFLNLTNTSPALTRTVMYSQGELRLLTTSHLQWAGTAGSVAYSPGSLLVFVQVDQTHTTSTCITDQETINATYAAISNALPFFGAAVTNSAGLGVLYDAVWTGAGAELSSTALATLRDRVINGPAVVSVTVAPSSATVAPTGTVQLTATATRADGTTFDCTATATWSSGTPSVATVSSSGLVTGVTAGSSTITATYTSLNATPASGTSGITVSGAINWPYTNRLPEFRTSTQRAGFVEVVLTATPAAAEWTAVDLDVFGRPSRAPSRNRS